MRSEVREGCRTGVNDCAFPSHWIIVYLWLRLNEVIDRICMHVCVWAEGIAASQTSVALHVRELLQDGFFLTVSYLLRVGTEQEPKSMRINCGNAHFDNYHTVGFFCLCCHII